MKPSSYTKIIIQVIFVVKSRNNLISENHERKIYAHIASHLKNKGHKPLIINGMPEHIHILFGLNPNQSISDLVRDLKRSTSLFINEEKLINSHFSWQAGYAAFSYTRWHLDMIYNYIANQKEHHRKRNFKEEYIDLLHQFKLSYDEDYLFDFLEK